MLNKYLERAKKEGKTVDEIAKTLVNEYRQTGHGYGTASAYRQRSPCRTWAGNIFSGNVNWENFLNYTLMAIPKEEYIPSMEDLCGDYLAKWGRD